MNVRKSLAYLGLEPGDRVVSAVAWRDMLVIVTERGVVYTVKGEQHD